MAEFIKVLDDPNRDLTIGVLFGDGGVGVGLRKGTIGDENRYMLSLVSYKDRRVVGSESPHCMVKEDEEEEIEIILSFTNSSSLDVVISRLQRLKAIMEDEK